MTRTYFVDNFKARNFHFVFYCGDGCLVLCELETLQVFGNLILAKLGLMLLRRHLWLKYLLALKLYIFFLDFRIGGWMRDWHRCLEFEGKALFCRDSDHCCHSCFVAFPLMSGRVCLVSNVLLFLKYVYLIWELALMHFILKYWFPTSQKTQSFYTLKPTSWLSSWERISVYYKKTRNT